jgi:hypothetical protein
LFLGFNANPFRVIFAASYQQCRAFHLLPLLSRLNRTRRQSAGAFGLAPRMWTAINVGNNFVL